MFWLRQDQADVPADDDWLSPAEADHLKGMRFLKRHADWRLGRWTAKRALAFYLNHPGVLADIEVRPTESGAPRAFIANQPAPAAISLSHSAGTALCALAPPDTALGCDVESIEPRSEIFLGDYFTPDEQSLVAGVPLEDRPLISTLLWSAKESALKVLGVGLRLDTRSIKVCLPDEQPGLLEGNERRVTATYGVNTWQPLIVHCDSGRPFDGWWKCSGKFVQTLLADPPAGRPMALPHL